MSSFLITPLRRNYTNLKNLLIFRNFICNFYKYDRNILCYLHSNRLSLFNLWIFLEESKIIYYLVSVMAHNFALLIIVIHQAWTFNCPNMKKSDCASVNKFASMQKHRWKIDEQNLLQVEATCKNLESKIEFYSCFQKHCRFDTSSGHRRVKRTTCAFVGRNAYWNCRIFFDTNEMWCVDCCRGYNGNGEIFISDYIKFNN